MCIIQCINCSCCLDLMLVPLKNDYFDGENPRPFQDWLRYDLVHRFCNAGRTHLVVYDRLCSNAYCIRRHPDYRPYQRERIGDKCDSAFCSEMTCSLVQCHGEDFCHEHFTGYDHLMQRPPVFRVRIFGPCS